MIVFKAGLSSLGVPGVPWHTQILADHLTLFQPGGTDYAHLITTGTPGFSNLPMALRLYLLSINHTDLFFTGIKPQEPVQANLTGCSCHTFLNQFISITVPARRVCRG